MSNIFFMFRISRFYSVMASTSVSESGNLSSNLGRTSFLEKPFLYSLLFQKINKSVCFKNYLHLLIILLYLIGLYHLFNIFSWPPMKIVIQRVLNARVLEESNLITKIDKGIVIYVGIEIDESEQSIRWLENQILNNLNSGEEALILSQFTLFATFKSGKPSFHKAERPLIAEKYFYNAVSELKMAIPGRIQNGIFGRKLNIELQFEYPNAKYLESSTIDL